MRQNGALGNTRRSTGILKERDISGLDVGFGKRQAFALGDGRVEFDMIAQRPGRHQLFHAADDDVDKKALGTEQVAHRCDDDVLERGLGCHLFDGVGEIFQDDDGLGAAVLQLMLEFPRRIERVDVDDDEASPKDRKDRHRVLQHVRHHDGHAVALLHPSRLQIGSEGIDGPG